MVAMDRQEQVGKFVVSKKELFGGRICERRSSNETNGRHEISDEDRRE